MVGRRCRRVPKERAYEVIGGYTVANDVSVRDWQRASPTMTMGKSWDTHGPIGPWIVTPDEVADPQSLRLSSIVDGEVRLGRVGENLVGHLDLAEHDAHVPRHPARRLDPMRR